MLDSVHIDGMITGVSPDHDTQNRSLSVGQHEPTHEASSIKRTPSGGHQVLQPDQIGPGFAHALQRDTRQAPRCAFFAAVCVVLQVADFVRDYKEQFPTVALKDVDECGAEINNMLADNRFRVKTDLGGHHDAKIRHCVRGNASLYRLLSEYTRSFVGEMLKVLHVLRGCNGWRGQHANDGNQRFHARHFIRARFGGQAVLSC
jgi:hypothetical protein